MSEENSNVMDFGDLAPVEVQVKHGGKRYVLREPSEAAVTGWQNDTGRKTRWRDGKPTGLDDFSDVQAGLLSRCLYAADAGGGLPLNEKGDPDSKHLVPAATIRTWPARVVKLLFLKCLEVGGLTAGAGESQGGEPSKNGLQEQDASAPT